MPSTPPPSDDDPGYTVGTLVKLSPAMRPVEGRRFKPNFEDPNTGGTVYVDDLDHQIKISVADMVQPNAIIIAKHVPHLNSGMKKAPLIEYRISCTLKATYDDVEQRPNSPIMALHRNLSDKLNGAPLKEPFSNGQIAYVIGDGSVSMSYSIKHTVYRVQRGSKIKIMSDAKTKGGRSTEVAALKDAKNGDGKEVAKLYYKFALLENVSRNFMFNSTELVSENNIVCKVT